MSRLRFAGEEMAKQETNLVAAMGRITDVDIAAESTRMAKYNVLVQASAAMLSQANSTTGVRADAPEVTHRMSKKLHHLKPGKPSPNPNRTGSRGQGGPRDKSNEIKEDNTMPLTINTNSAAASANYHLSRNQSALQKSLTRLSSGSRIVQPVDDAGGLAVSMKLESSIVRLGGAAKNAPKRHFFSSRSRMEFWLRRAKSSTG